MHLLHHHVSENEKVLKRTPKFEIFKVVMFNNFRFECLRFCQVEYFLVFKVKMNDFLQNETEDVSLQSENDESIEVQDIHRSKR